MDFYDLLKVAAGNQKNAEKRLPDNKRYNLKFSPMKKTLRPKVSQAAIKARLKKKEEERKQAELEEKKKQEALTLRAEQEAAKSQKKPKPTPCSSSSSATGGFKKTVEPKKRHSQNGKGGKYGSEERRSRPEEPRSDSETEREYQSQETEQQKLKARPRKEAPSAKKKPKALSFKELMALANANKNGFRPETPVAQNAPSTSVHKEESDRGQAKVRGRRQPDSGTVQSGDSIKRNGAHKSHKTKIANSNGDVNNGAHRRSRDSSPKLSGGNKKTHSTLFPNVRKTVSDDSNTPSHSKPSGSSSMRKKSEQKDSGSKKASSSSSSSSSSVLHNGVGRSKVESKVGKTKKVQDSMLSPLTAKRKGGWLDPVRPSVPDVIAKPERESPSSISKDINRGVAGAKDSPRERPSPKPSERKREGLKASAKTKGGWLDAAEDSSPMKNPPQARKKDVSTASVSSRNKSMTPKAAAPPPKGKNNGWLNPVGGLPKEKGGGGWLGPARDHVSQQSTKRKGGWLGSVQESALKVKRGRLLSSEDEDSDLDGFIDDTPLEDEGEDVSSYIKEIFGYDKSKYKDESDYALRYMESSYSEMMKEEQRSARIAQQEDLDDIRKEKEEMKRKAAKAKKR